MKQVNCENCGNAECKHIGRDYSSYCSNYIKAKKKATKKPRYRQDLYDEVKNNPQVKKYIKEKRKNKIIEEEEW